MHSVTIAAHFFALLTLILVLGLVFHDDLGGLKEYPMVQFFNWHPLLMVRGASRPPSVNVCPATVPTCHPFSQTIAFPVCMTEAILAYRASPGHKVARQMRAGRKVVHLIFHGLAVTLGLIGVIFVFMNHHCQKAHEDDECKSIPHLYSLHSWVGLLAMVLSASQFGFGFYAYWMKRNVDATCGPLGPPPGRVGAEQRPPPPPLRHTAGRRPCSRLTACSACSPSTLRWRPCC